MRRPAVPALFKLDRAPDIMTWHRPDDLPNSKVSQGHAVTLPQPLTLTAATARGSFGNSGIVCDVAVAVQKLWSASVNASL